MKRVILFLLVAAFIFASTSALAASTSKHSKAVINKASFKVDWLVFTDELLVDTDSSEALYIAIEMRSPVTPLFDIGMEVGYTKFSGDIVGPKSINGKSTNFLGTWENTITYVPIEFNLSYSRYFGNMVYMMGSGLSGNYVKMDIDVNDTGTPFTFTDEDSAWLLGAQVFFDLTYEGETYFFGIDGKYQIVEETDFFNQWLDVNFSNWRTGIHIGTYY